jgi:hypothetical protein
VSAMTYTAPTAAQLRVEIATVARQMNEWGIEGRLDSDQEAEMKAEIYEMKLELNALEEMEPVRDRYAPTGGINISLACQAFGLTPEALDKWLGEEAA